ncbi:MAG TPA: L-threonylcarbamoyladenylate synthase [Vicinamibacterales bacterium]|nr:L-threonylcarbamoyladenylate synthase [Vicinamibacterales bacterium]
MIDDTLSLAAAALRRGEAVVFPTETVYGLGANALDAAAVARVFAIKGRPPDNPLIVHVLDEAAARPLTDGWPEVAHRLAEAFWPGALTIVLPKAPHVPGITTAGLDSIALRAPAHPVARALLRATGLPLAAPSANTSGRPSPTRVDHARADLGDRVAIYVDGGPTDLGLESTVVDVRVHPPRLLRPGAISREAIERITGPLAPGDAAAAGASPGTRHRHYAPRARVELVDRDRLAARYRELAASQRVGAVVTAPVEGVVSETLGHDPRDWGRRLFAVLRELEERDVILVERPPAAIEWEAVDDRLRRAASR